MCNDNEEVLYISQTRIKGSWESYLGHQFFAGRERHLSQNIGIGLECLFAEKEYILNSVIYHLYCEKKCLPISAEEQTSS